MKENFLHDVAQLCRVSESDIAFATATQQELVKNFILPRAVNETGQDIRGWRISSEFMQFMADWGQTLIDRDQKTGELLMEIALQRLTKGAITREVHKNAEFEKAIEDCKVTEQDSPAVREQKISTRAKKYAEYLNATTSDLYAYYNPWFALPEEYRKYSNWEDQPGLMDQKCWNFVEANLEYCVNLLRNDVWRGHAEKLLAGLIQHTNEEGEALQGYLWNEQIVQKSLKEVYTFAEELACRHFGIQKVAEILFPTWRAHKSFFKKHQKEIDFDVLFKDWGENESGLDYEREGKNYFGKKQLCFLRFIGRDKKAIADKVIAEMVA